MTTQLTPEVNWAQRSSSSDPERNHVFLTLMVPDVKKDDMKLNLETSKLTFDGYSTSKKAQYHVELEFYAEIDPDESKISHSGRDIEMVLRKKELKDEFWPRLLKESKKQHFLKTDFDKWVDEDEQDAAADDEYMNNMAGMGGAGGMGGGGDGGFGGIDFSKLGQGGGGMPDLSSMGDMGGMGDMGDMASMLGGAGGAGGPPGGDDDSDDDMPELEDEGDAKEGGAEKEAETEAESGTSAPPKIEEVS